MRTEFVRHHPPSARRHRIAGTSGGVSYSPFFAHVFPGSVQVNAHSGDLMEAKEMPGFDGVGAVRDGASFFLDVNNLKLGSDCGLPNIHAETAYFLEFRA